MWYLRVDIAGRGYGVVADEVESILMMAAWSRLDGMPSWVAGVLNLHGEMIPVIDLAQRWGIARPAGPTGLAPDGSPWSAFPHGSRLLVFRMGGRRFATWVDRVGEFSSGRCHRLLQGESTPHWQDGLLVDDSGEVPVLRLSRLLAAVELAEWTDHD